MYPIKRVFGIYDSYSEARNKLKKAEMNSDINTDTDDKAQRKIRARKQIDTDDDESDDESDDDRDSDPLRLPSYPKAPTVVYTNMYKGDARNIPKTELKNILKICTKEKPKDLPSLIGRYPKEITIHKKTKNILQLKIYTKEIPKDLPFPIGRYPKETTIHKKEMKNITIKNYLHRMNRTLADIKFDINHLIEQYQLILTKMNSNNGFNLTRECHSPLPNDELSKLSFPLKTVELECLQCMLFSNEERLKERMSYFSILAAIGGSTYEEMAKRMLIYIFTNEVASLYSWVGGKGKRKLHHLEIMKLMFKVIRKTFPNVTEKDFETKYKDWFRHAKYRFENEKRRQSNSTQGISKILRTFSVDRH